MPYAALPSARRAHYEIDGSVVGWNQAGTFSSGMVNVVSGANMLSLNEETPTAGNTVICGVSSSDLYTFVLFPELIDLTYFLARYRKNAGVTPTWVSVESSPDTTTGADGTWNTVTFGAGTSHLEDSTSGDWWRATAPAAVATNGTGIKGLRFRINFNSGNNNSNGVSNLYLWSNKHSGETPDDIIFLQDSGGTPEWPNDDDLGDQPVVGGAITRTYYVKNTSPTKTANTITVKPSGSDNSVWTVSLDNVSFASSKSIASLAAGATQVVYFKITPPAPGSGVYRPYAAYLEADVTSWT